MFKVFTFRSSAQMLCLLKLIFPLKYTDGKLEYYWLVTLPLGRHNYIWMNKVFHSFQPVNLYSSILFLLCESLYKEGLYPQVNPQCCAQSWYWQCSAQFWCGWFSFSFKTKTYPSLLTWSYILRMNKVMHSLRVTQQCLLLSNT